jgi:hypothetical protein
MKKLFFIFFLLCFSLGYGFDLPKKPMRSAFYSLIIPGGGQYYNENYWKFGGVVAIEGYFIARTIYHQLEANSHYDKYRKSLLQTDYQNYLHYYYEVKNDYWWLGTTIVLSMIDAYVDAHLFNYDANKEKINLKFFDKKISLEFKFY